MRQAHPGPAAPPYRYFEQKRAEARAYRQQEGIDWPILVDDLVGHVHQAYAPLADPTYLIDRDGRVACHIMWTYVPTLERAIAALLEQGGRGVVLGGRQRWVHPLPALADGWRGIARGLPQSADDLNRIAPGSAALLNLGYRLQPVLAPLALRSRPLPMPVLLALALVGLTLARWRRGAGLMPWGVATF